MSSETSLGMGSGLEEENGDGLQFIYNLSPEGGPIPNETVYDCISMVIYCKVHDKIALTRTLRDGKLRAVWLPYVVSSAYSNWMKQVRESIRLIFKKEDPNLPGQYLRIPTTEPIRIDRQLTQMPATKESVTRLTYLVRVMNNYEFKCCENTKRIQWYPISEAISGKIDKCWGPEIRQFAAVCKWPKKQITSFFNLSKSNKFVTTKSPKNTEEEIIQIMEIQIKDVKIFYADYLEHCFPSTLMTIHSFKDYLIKYGYSIDDQRFIMLFNAFDYRQKQYIDFTQLLIGLSLMDPKVPNKEYRVKFIFRYYDIDCDGKLSWPELVTLIQDLGPKDDNEMVTKKAKEWLNIMNGSKRDNCTYDEFKAGVGSLKLRGTSTLCRLKTSILYSTLLRSLSSRGLVSKNVSHKRKVKKEKLCPKCRPKNNELQDYTGVLDSDAFYTDSQLIRESFEDTTDPFRQYAKFFTFSPEYVANVYLELIREFNDRRKQNNDIKGFSTEDSEREAFPRTLYSFCTDAEHIFSNEPRVIYTNGPAYILGDICGNLHDLMSIESMLWKKFPIISEKLVFLGNYTTGGKWGVECLIYLIALKLICPTKVFLLRGRQEVGDIQMEKNFQKECFEKYGESLGKKLWQMFNHMFDRMPLALVIDGTVFCTNSGIPNTKTKAKDFNKMSPNIKNQLKNYPIFNQLLFNELIGKPLTVKTGFQEVPGKSHQYVFDESAVNNFLQYNGFDFIICGNKSTANGFGIQFGGKFTTVCSNTNFQDTNKAAVLRLDKHKILVMFLCPK